MISENKKGVKAVKHTVKTKNPVAKAHQTVGSGSGEHKDKKRVTTQIRGQKHKSKELAEFAMLAPIAGAVGRAVVGGIARTAANSFADDEPTENSEYDDEAGMADNNLETLHRAVVGLDELISAGDNLPEWCQEKIAVAKSMLVTVWDYMQSEEDSLAEGYDPVESDYEQWEYILVKDGSRGDPSGANALELVAGDHRGREGYISTIRNILAYVKQNRQALGTAVSDRKTVKDCIMDIKREYPQLYQAAQQPQGVAEGAGNVEIGQQMANDGITYSPEKENELIDLMAQYMKKSGMSSKSIRYYLSYDEDYIPDQLSYLPKQGVAEGFPKDPNAPKLVRDRKTGKQYDPNKEFEKKMNSPEVMAQMKRMAQKEGVAGPKQCWPNHRKVGTQPGTGKNKGKRVNDCEKISESNWYEVRLQTMLNETLKK